MNSLYSALKINNINDSAMVYVDGEYKGQVMPMTDLRELLKAEADEVTWTRKVLIDGSVVEKTMQFKKSTLIEFAKNRVSENVFGQMSTDQMVIALRGENS
ncbi:hypothetical protein JL49_13210 [Pseudoalteromonas luteoviolacea]|nr:hypothetical protein JL49_13210 [Pseudoalteromonas luteoviolacea]